LLERDIPDDKKVLIERELKNLYSGNKGKKTSAYYLDFDFKTYPIHLTAATPVLGYRAVGLPPIRKHPYRDEAKD
jgi:hypothetical protein